ncbi:adhesion G protein-coupled receptor F5-like [Protopterus annectens]|uniref:adhesion G protein-coupled receptor F5-like n=1 Tax=Protopterus annectens TaxID=7888 RepID=UPI001CFA0BF9|nr:adhesion G protein-coupled receptor F5-like [Protopterus annectens]
MAGFSAQFMPNRLDSADLNLDFITVVNSVVEDSSVESWTALNAEGNYSSQLLMAMETFSSKLSQNGASFNATSNSINLQSVKMSSASVHEDYTMTFHSPNVTGKLLIPEGTLKMLSNDTQIVSTVSSTLGKVLPLKFQENSRSSSDYIQTDLVITAISLGSAINNLQLIFQGPDYSTLPPLCVFWDFTLNNHQGGWNDFGCYSEISGSNTVCTCEHLTSFSMLMSTVPVNYKTLDYLTCAGLGVSIGSLVLCLLTEKMVWKLVTKNKTSYMRHLSIVHIAFSLLIADMCFVASTVTKPQTKTCISLVFLIHLFYLSMFFWMLTLGLIIFYRLVFIYHDMKISVMKNTAYVIGYGIPLVIAILTVIVTYPKNTYTRKNACWLNWDESKALLAFIVPVLLIVNINLFTVIVVLSKLLRPSVGDANKHAEKHTMVQIAKSVAILTPFLGLTWGFGISMVVGNSSYSINLIFTALNSFQVCYVLKGFKFPINNSSNLPNISTIFCDKQ